MIPKHTAIIMDGNGRWAENKGMPRVFGHENGVRAVKKIVEEHNGTIKIENIQPHGAYIAITLPAISENDSTITREIT